MTTWRSGKRKIALLCVQAIVLSGLAALFPNSLCRAQTYSPVCRPITNDPLSKLHGNSCDWEAHEFTFSDGKTLPSVRIHYVSMGEPHRDRDGQIDNAVLLIHWTGASGSALLKPEFQSELYGPGKPLDSSLHFLIVIDNVGHGLSSKPSDGMRADFPHYTYGDLIVLQHALVTQGLRIKRLRAIVGLSMGGMNAWQWAEKYPTEVQAIMPVVSLPVRVSGRNLLWRRLAIQWILDDPEWRKGIYSQNPPSFLHAWQLAMLMIEGVPHFQASLPNSAATDAYIDTVQKQAETLDANDLLYSLDASRDYDPEPLLGTVSLPVYALNFADDEFNPDVLQILEHSVAQLRHARYVVQASSAASHGHLTMAHPHLWADQVANFMRFNADGTNQ